MQIDHDPNEGLKDLRPVVFGYAAMMTPLYVWTRGWPATGWLDHLALILFLCLLWWLLSPGVRRHSGHEGAGDGFAFRFGKALGSVLGTRRG